MKRVALFAGSFDPFTKGHEDIVLRGLQLFDEVIIGIGVNTNKTRHFAVEQMVQKLNEVFKDHKNVKVTTYQGLTAEFAKKSGTKFFLRG